VVLGSAPSIMPEDLPETLLDTPVPQGREEGGFHDAVREAKKRLILEAIDQAKGNISEAARSLRLHPNYLHRLVTTLRLR
jgi:DNA-binding NtrC family response regulator